MRHTPEPSNEPSRKDALEALEKLRTPWMKEQTVKDRRMLLGTSGVGILVAATGLVPTEITALGVRFSSQEGNAFLLALGAVVLYLTVSFWTSVGVDWWSRRRLVLLLQDQLRTLELQDESFVRSWQYARIGRFLDRIFPVGLGITAFLALLARIAFG